MQDPKPEPPKKSDKPDSEKDPKKRPNHNLPEIHKIRIRQLQSGKDKLPNQGLVSSEKMQKAPPVDAGKQGKHVSGHNNCNPKKSLWPKGENGVELTQEAWVKGKFTKNPDKVVKIYKKGNLEIKVHIDKDGYIHGYPNYPQK